MRKLFIPLCTLITLAGCGSNNGTKAHSPTFFITGTYAAWETGRFCTTWDTLYISRDKEQKNIYWINRKTVYQRNCSDRYFRPEIITTAWKGVLPPDDANLIGLDGSPSIQFVLFPQVNALRLDYAKYTRIE